MDPMVFHHRWRIGQRLSKTAVLRALPADTIVVGAPGGGMVIAAAIAETLRLPLELLYACPPLCSRSVILATDTPREDTRFVPLPCGLRAHTPRRLVCAATTLKRQTLKMVKPLTDSLVLLQPILDTADDTDEAMADAETIARAAHEPVH